MSRNNIQTLRRAAILAGVSAETVREWCHKYGIGRYEAGVWHISRAGLNKIIRARTVLGK